jgi:hypothetical protein
VPRLRAVLVAVLSVVALGTTASTAASRQGPVEDGTLSIRDGRANLVLRMKGGAIGRFARGKLTVTESDTATVLVFGAERERFVNERTTVYSGKNVRFRVMDERRFVVRLNASKIGLSAVGRGDGWIDGWGNPSKGVFFDGSYSLNGGPYRSIPDVREELELAAPASG